MIQDIRNYVIKYGFILIWLITGALNSGLGSLAVVTTFIFLIIKQRYVQLIVGLWVLFIFSDNQYAMFRFASAIKPVVMLITGSAILFGKLQIRSKNNFIIVFIPFFVYCAISSTFSIVVMSSYQKLLSYFFIYLITSFTISQIFHEKKGVEFIKDMVYMGIIILTYSLVLGIVFPGLGLYYGGRLNGIFRNPNGLGLFTAIFFMLSSLFFRISNAFSRRLRRYTFFLVLAVLIMSGSRTSMGASTIFFVGSVMSSFSPWYFVIFASILFYFFTDIYNLIAFSISRAGFGNQLRLSTVEDASGRIFIWRAAWMEIQSKYFLFGGGFDFAEGAYKIWKPKYNIIMPEIKNHVGNVHQSFLTTWLNNGIVGLTLFCYGWIRKIMESLNKSKETLPLTFGLVFIASYESWLVASMNPFTIQVIIMFTVILSYNKEDVQVENEEIKEKTITEYKFTPGRG